MAVTNNQISTNFQNLNLHNEMPIVPPVYIPSHYENSAIVGDVGSSKIFMLIKPTQRRSVEISFLTGKWVFAPQTEKKILHLISLRKKVFLLFTVNCTHAFQGVARFINIYTENVGKPRATIEWIFKFGVSYSQLRYLRNPLNNNRLIYEGTDGQIVDEESAAELLRIFVEERNKTCYTYQYQ